MKHYNRFAAFLMTLVLLCSLIGTASAATVGEQNALRTADAYLSFMAFSYSGLIDQLEYDGYSHAEATYAADNCGADWNENAVTTAQNYLSFMGFSYSGLVDQLEYEGYTTQQAKYAADICFGLTTAATATPQPTATPKASGTTPSAATPPFAGDFSAYSFEELKQLQTELNLALWASEGWQKVTVPPGIYVVGEDIPEGRWTIKRAANKYTYLRIYSDMQNGVPTNRLHYSHLEDSFTVHLISGQYVEIDSTSVTFEPYVSGLGFTFN